MFALNTHELDLDILEEEVDEAFQEYEVTDAMVPETGCSVGDRVTCKVKDTYLIARHEKGEAKILITIIAKLTTSEGEFDYIAYVPEDVRDLISSSAYRIRPDLAKAHRIHKKYVGEFGVTLRKSNIWKVEHAVDGMHCRRCEEFYNKAAPNQEDGTLLCYLCRQNPWR